MYAAEEIKVFRAFCEVFNLFCAELYKDQAQGPELKYNSQTNGERRMHGPGPQIRLLAVFFCHSLGVLTAV